MKKTSIFIILCTCIMLCGCGNKEENNTEPKQPNITENHVVYYQKENGDIVTSIEIENNSTTPDELAGIGFADISASWSQLETKQVENDGEVLYQMLLYAELESGFQFKFDEMNIKGIDFYNDNYQIDGKFIDGTQLSLSNDEDINRYLVTLTCSEPFTLNDVTLYAYNETNENYEKNQLAIIKNMDMGQVNLHKTFPTTTQFFCIEGDYYVFSQGLGRKYLDCEPDTIKVAITEESILWCSDGGSAEKLFHAIASNYKWANKIGETPFDSEATLEIINDDEFGICLVKTAKYGLDDETSNPTRIVYQEDGYEPIYITIV